MPEIRDVLCEHCLIIIYLFQRNQKCSPLNILRSFLLIVECLVALGYKREDIEASLAQTRYDDVHATYLLISRKNTDVSSKPTNHVTNNFI